MKHSSNRTLFAHWEDRRRQRPAPERGEIEPGAIKSALADTFILSYNPFQKHPFRLAGTRLCALFGRELKGSAFIDLWDIPKRGHVGDLAAIVADESVGVVAGAVGWTAEGFSLDFELLLLPLRHGGRTHARLIGALAPLRVPAWVGAKPIESLAISSHRYVEAAADLAADTVPIFPNPAIRVRHGLIVYDGGQV